MDGLVEVARGLYALPLARFVAERNARARAADDRELATAVRALPKPSVAAWALNALVAHRPDVLD